jgi:hypothetical protein
MLSSWYDRTIIKPLFVIPYCFGCRRAGIHEITIIKPLFVWRTAKNNNSLRVDHLLHFPTSFTKISNNEGLSSNILIRTTVWKDSYDFKACLRVLHLICSWEMSTGSFDSYYSSLCLLLLADEIVFFTDTALEWHPLNVYSEIYVRTFEEISHIQYRPLWNGRFIGILIILIISGRIAKSIPITYCTSLIRHFLDFRSSVPERNGIGLLIKYCTVHGRSIPFSRSSYPTSARWCFIA